MSSDQESRSNPTEYAKAALQMMEKKGIPPKPNNFAVWYRYFSGAYPELSRTLDVILEAGLPFTEERNAEIYDRFLGVTLDEDFLNDATLRVETELKKLMSYLEEAGDDAQAYGDTLSVVSGELAAGDGRQDIRAVLEQVIAATRHMEDRNQVLEARLKESAHEIESLKEDVESLRHEAMTENKNSKGGEYQCGDQVLRVVARILKSCVRGEDLTARYGGEEFSIVLRDTNLVNGAKVGEHVRNQVCKKAVVNRATGKSLGTITISVGAAEFTPGESIENLIERADEALYLAKHNGRNRVEMGVSGTASQTEAQQAHT